MKSIITLLFIIFLGGLTPVFGNEVGYMSRDELKSKLGSTDLIVLDVRTSPDWDSSDTKIQQAIRENPNAVDTWAGNYDKAKTIVLYCA